MLPHGFPTRALMDFYDWSYLNGWITCVEAIQSDPYKDKENDDLQA